MKNSVEVTRYKINIQKYVYFYTLTARYQKEKLENNI